MTHTTAIRFLAAALLANLVLFQTASATPYNLTVLGDNPLAYWTLDDEAPTATDATGNGHDGTRSGPGVAFEKFRLLPGSANQGTTAVQLPNGVKTDVPPPHRIEIPAFDKFPVGSTGFSTEYWIRVNGAHTGFTNIVGDGVSGGSFFMMNYLTAGNQIRPHFNGSGTTSIDSNGTLTVGTRYHVVTTWDQGTGDARIWITPEGATTVQLDKSQNIGTGAPSNTGNAMFLGRDNRENSADFTLDEVAIYNFALSEAQIQAHFDAAQLSLVPEPNSGLLLGAAILGLIRVARRKRRI